jgi:hypothetical protein
MISNIEAVEEAKNNVAKAINENEGEVWPFNVWEVWQKLESSVAQLRDAYDDMVLEAKEERPE